MSEITRSQEYKLLLKEKNEVQEKLDNLRNDMQRIAVDYNRMREHMIGQHRQIIAILKAQGGEVFLPQTIVKNKELLDYEIVPDLNPNRDGLLIRLKKPSQNGQVEEKINAV